METFRARNEIGMLFDLLHFWQDEYRNFPSNAHFEVCVRTLEQLLDVMRRYLPAGDARVSVVARNVQLARLACMAQSTPPVVGSRDADKQ